MRILDRYIIKNVAASYIFILLVFIGLYFIIDIFSNLSDVLKTKPPFFILLEYYIHSVPLIILRVSPLALLISTLYTFGELNKNNEIISIRASGQSILRLSLPVIVFTFFISTSAFFLQEKILIHSQKKAEDLKTEFIDKNLTYASVENNIAFTSGGMVLFAGKFIPAKELLENVIIFKEGRDGKIVKKTICKNLVYQYGFWVAKNGVEYDFDKDGDVINIPVNFMAKKINLKERPQDLAFKRSIFAQFISLANLKKEIKRLKQVKAGSILSSLTIDYYQKISEPFSHLFLVIGILPLALEIKKKKVTLSSLGVGFIFGFIYYSFSSFSIALGKSNIILPILSAWLTPLFFLAIGISGLLLIR